jgi:hypothetical protein
MADQVVKHALLIVFEYGDEYITLSKGKSHEQPSKLLAMNKDLTLAYKMANEKFGIERKNITVITDVTPNRGESRPWDPLTPSDDNPKIIQLPYPEITQIIREIAQFIENTIRGIADLVNKGDEVTNEVFIYVSGHGALVPSIPEDDEEYSDDTDNALIFMTKRKGKNNTRYFQRRYLRANDIFKLFFGHNFVTNDGFMSVPITRRSLVKDKDGDYYIFDDDELCRFQLTPITDINPLSTRSDYTSLSNRGLPPDTNMLVVFDTCHSGKMADFHYIYDPHTKQMGNTNNFPTGYSYPYCVSLAASEDSSTAPSTSKGSPFTHCISKIFNTVEHGLTIDQFHDRIYEKIPRMLKECKPTICSTSQNHNKVVPFLTNLPQS